MSTETSYLTPPLVKAIYAYVDVVRVWVHVPLTDTDESYLREHCGSVHVWNKPMKYQPRWCKRIQLNQPSTTALSYLNMVTRGNHLINYVELALDLIADDAPGADALHQYLDMHLVQPWHGKQRPWSHVTSSYNSSKRWVRNNNVIYSSRPSKVTGEVHCCHLERRIATASAVRAAGITNLASLIGFDQAAFWEKRLQLRAIDLSKLGRAARKTKRRTPWTKTWTTPSGRTMTIDLDAMLGRQIARAAQRPGPDGNPVREIGCAQEIMDYCKDRWGLDIRRAVIKLDATPLLARTRVIVICTNPHLPS